jgi:hypothetical protein
MWDAILFAAAVCARLGADVAGQVMLALLVAYAWEYEKAALWSDVTVFEHPLMTDLALLVTGVATGLLGVLAWPRMEIDQLLVLQAATAMSPVAAGVLMYRAGQFLRRRGYEPPALLAVHAITIFALGVALVRAAILTNV